MTLRIENKAGKPRRSPGARNALSAKAGQAVVEFVVGLVVVLVLLAGMLQLAALTKAQTDTMVEARRRAGEEAVDVNVPMDDPEFIRDWEAGADGFRHTADDAYSSGDAIDFQAVVVEHAVDDPDDWRVLDEAQTTHVSDLHRGVNPVDFFGLLRESSSETVELMPAVRELIYDKDSITVRSDVWMTWTKGIY